LAPLAGIEPAIPGLEVPAPAQRQGHELARPNGVEPSHPTFAGSAPDPPASALNWGPIGESNSALQRSKRRARPSAWGNWPPVSVLPRLPRIESPGS